MVTSLTHGPGRQHTEHENPIPTELLNPARLPPTAGVNAPAISFELDGQQFIAVVAAGSRYSELHGSALLVFGLGAGPGANSTPAGGAVTQSATPVVPDREEAWPPENATRVDRYLSYGAPNHTVWIDLDAGGHGAGGPSFDGAVNGERTFVVPLEWRVEVRFRNRDVAPHAARVVIDARPVPLAPGPASFAGGETESVATGLAAGRQDFFNFRADRSGEFLLACGVPGHAAGGMFLTLIVSRDATVPSYR